VARRRVRGDGGYVLVESAFVLPIVLLVVFSIMEFGLLFAAQSTTNSATRGGARVGSANFAVAADKKAAADQVAQEVADDLAARTSFDTPLNLYVYKADQNGNPQSGTFSNCANRCYRYTWSGSGWTYDASSNQWTDPNACIVQDPNNPNAGINTLDTMGVYVELRHNYITGFIGSSQTIKEHTVSRLEPLPLSQC